MKEILVLFQSHQIAMLIPKQRGEGFKKVPLGHHACPLSALAYEIGYDLYGLDGALEVQTGYIALDDHERLTEKAVRPLAKFFGLPWRVVGMTEFWAKHPLKTAPVT